MQEQIERDLKTAMLSGDKLRVETLKGLKNALLYEAVNLQVKPADLKNEQIISIFAKESKKRREAIEVYEKVGESKRAEIELAEKTIIDQYLPEQLSESEVETIVKEEVSKLDNPEAKDMGRIIGAVRGRLQGKADGALIAKLVKQALES